MFVWAVKQLESSKVKCFDLLYTIRLNYNFKMRVMKLICCKSEFVISMFAVTAFYCIVCKC